jgi:predicted phage replisome organizer
MMADSEKYYYMRLKDTYFDSDVQLMLESMQDGYLYSNILLKLYLRSLKSNGRLMLTDRIPYNPQMIATATRHQVGTVERALNVFRELGLIDIMDTGAIYMLDIQNFVGKSSTEAERKREYRARIEAETTLGIGQMSGQMSTEHADKCLPEIEIEQEKNTEIKKKSKSRAKRATPRHKYGVYQNVLLSDEELETLKTEFPDWEKRVERLSEYIASRGDKYKSHLATIRSWARRDGSGGGGGSPAPRQAKVNPAQQYVQRKYDSDAIKARVAVDIKALLDDDEGERNDADISAADRRGG